MSWKDLFSFSKSELRGIAVLLVLIISVIIYRYNLLNKQEKQLLAETNKFEKEIKDFETKIDSVHRAKKVSKKIQPQPKSKGEVLHKSNIPVTEKKKIKKEQILRININTADAGELKKLKGIGEKLSARIVRYREKLGGFYSIEQIKEVYGIKPETYKSIKSHIYCKGRIKKINVNKATFKELVRHPYLSYKEVKEIFKFRDKNIPLSQEKIIGIVGNKKADKLLHYVEF
jgi:competence protein ComEA